MRAKFATEQQTMGEIMQTRSPSLCKEISRKKDISKKFIVKIFSSLFSRVHCQLRMPSVQLPEKVLGAFYSFHKLLAICGSSRKHFMHVRMTDLHLF